MDRIPTADEYVRANFQLSDKYDYENHKEKLINFAKLHCLEQAKKIKEKAKMKMSSLSDSERTSTAKEIEHFNWKYSVDEESILNAYPLDNIK